MIMESLLNVNEISGILSRLFKLPPEDPPPPAEIPAPPIIGPQLPPPLPLQRPPLKELAALPPAELPLLVQLYPVALRYLHRLGPLNWDAFPERDRRRAWPGPVPQSKAPFAAAFLVKVEQDLKYMTDLRDFLLEHPPLIWVLGFELVPDSRSPWGFDPEASLPSRKHLGRVLRELPNESLQFLLSGAVSLLKDALPADSVFGNTIAMDTKAILAWVAENNPKAYIKESDRLNKKRQPEGDPDSKLGCKRRRNRASAATDPATTAAATAEPAEPAPAVAAKTPAAHPKPATNLSPIDEFYWGYASAVVTTKVPGYGEFVIAETTQTFDQGDAANFYPLMAAVERNLGRKPQFGAFDAAYDCFYVHQYFIDAGGFAAVPFAPRGGYTVDSRQFDAGGLPLCRAGLSMPLKSTFTCKSEAVEHERGRFACPLLFPTATGQACPADHKNFAKGGCLTTMPTCAGARARYQLDRKSEAYKLVYNQRTATERINSQAKELGIERPTLRNRQSIANTNTLIYVVMNLKALDRVKAKTATETV